jgi:type II secretory pathway component GspD/PulD (secretin)
MVARAFKQVWVSLALGALIAYAISEMGGAWVHAQARPSRARSALTTGIDCLRKGDLELAAQFFQQAQAGEEDLSPAERQELASRLQYVETALKSRSDGNDQLRKAEDAAKSNRTQEALNLLKEVSANPDLKQADQQRADQLREQIQPRSNTPSQITTSTTGTAPLLQARSKLKNARGLLVKGEYDAAEVLAKEAKALDVVYTPGEDTPQKVLDDINRARTAKQDTKTLLNHARAALERGDLDTAEKLAKQSEASESFWVVHIWGDSPSKVLKEVKEARAKALAKAGKTDAKDSAVAKAATKTEAKDTTPPKTEAKDHATAKANVKTEVKDSSKANSSDMANVAKTAGKDNSSGSAKAQVALPTPPSRDTDAARQLLKQGRRALLDGNYAEAERLANEAKKKNPDLNWWDDTPEKLVADIRRSAPVAAKTDAASDKAKTTAEKGKVSSEKAKASDNAAVAKSTDAENDPRNVLKQARDQFSHGKLEDAKELALKANGGNVKWGLFEDSPDKLLAEIQTAKTKRDKEESVRLLTDARKLFDQGNLDDAERKAYQAERLHGSYSIWDMGDRPHKLVAEIEAARAKNRKTKIQPPPPIKVAEVDGNKIATDKTKVDQVATEKAKTDQVATEKAKTNQLAAEKAKTDQVAKVPSVINEQKTAENKVERQPSGGELEHTSPLAGRRPDTSVQDFTKQRARQLLTECRDLQRQGQLAEARQKATDAQRLCASYDVGEDYPERALQELAVLAEKQIDNLKQAATDHSSEPLDPNRCRQAENELVQARQLAQAFGLDLQPLDGSLAQLRQLMGGQPDLITKTGLQDGNRDKGLQLLSQARLELQHGNTPVSRRIAEEAFSGPYGVQAEAAALLRSIDAEEFEQTQRALKHQVDIIVETFRHKDYQQVGALIEKLDMAQLPPNQRDRVKNIMDSPEIAHRQVAVAQPNQGSNQPTNVNDKEFAQQVKDMQEVKFQALRNEGIRAQQEAMERVQTGKMDQAIEILQGYRARVSESGLESESAARLVRPIEKRVQDLKTLKSQKEWEQIAREKSDKVSKNEAKRVAAEDTKRKSVTELMETYQTFVKEGKYDDAVMYAMKAHELDPDNPATSAAMQCAQVLRNQDRANKRKNNNEEIFVTGMDENEGPSVTPEDPVHFDKKRSEMNRNRLKLVSGPIGRKSEKEREIERRLQSPGPAVKFDNTPLKQVLDDLRELTGLNIVTDQPALDEANISADRPVSIQLEAGVSLKSVFNLILKNIPRLTYIIDNEVLQITTDTRAKGKLVQKTYPVADLVIPVDNYMLPQGANFYNALNQNPNNQPNVHLNGTSPVMGRNSITGGTNVSTPSDGSQYQPDHGGPGGAPPNPQAGNRAPGQTDTMQNLLIKLITNNIASQTWAEAGGPGTIDYFPLGMALIINQTPDVQEQVQDLLDALRRLQDLEVAVEVRMISLEESFFERIGIDFNINIPTQSINGKTAQTQIVTQQFQPLNLLNNFTPERFIAGLQPAASGAAFSPAQAFTSDLGIPLRNSSFQYAIPPFGGFPNIPGADGGLSMGLAFLSDIQVYMFMEAAQGDRRTNVMQAPKLTLFNGQTATIQIQDFQWFVTNVQVVQNAGQVVFVPQNQPIPMGINLAIQAVVSGDRRFVRLNIAPTMVNLASATVPLFPVTTFITPVFEGGAQGQPVPFTQFIQQPTFTTVTIQTTVSVPDGGTVLLGGLKLMNEGRNEFGPPVLSKIPYLNRLFKNVGYGKDTSSLLLMVTPRVIINTEEEFLQTGVDSTGLLTNR